MPRGLGAALKFVCGVNMDTSAVCRQLLFWVHFYLVSARSFLLFPFALAVFVSALFGNPPAWHGIIVGPILGSAACAVGRARSIEITGWRVPEEKGGRERGQGYLYPCPAAVLRPSLALHGDAGQPTEERVCVCVAWQKRDFAPAMVVCAALGHPGSPLSRRRTVGQGDVWKHLPGVIPIEAWKTPAKIAFRDL